MAMNAIKFNILAGNSFLDRFKRFARFECKTEFAVDLTCFYEIMSPGRKRYL